jgi:acetate kinase
MSRRRFLLVNTGSSSVKLTMWLNGVAVRSERLGRDDDVDLAAFVAPYGSIDAVVHRVVHAGDVQRHVVLTPALEHAIHDATPLAPLHNPQALRFIARARSVFGPEVPQLAAVDTAFFIDLPAESARYALSPEAGNFRRYGFHGLAHSYMNRRCFALDHVGPRRIISLQLGAGCSAAAAFDGVAIESSMGFSPSEGLMMATRAGDVDPGLLIHLVRRGASADDLDRLINREGGLVGVCGDDDMRTVLARADAGDPRASLALAMYCHRIRKIVGAFSVALGGVEAIVFGGGVGENSPEIRSRVIDPLRWLGIDLDHAHNRRINEHDAIITSGDTRASVWVVHVDEAAEMARIGEALLSEASVDHLSWAARVTPS